MMIRPFEPTDEEYEAIAAVEKAVWADNADSAADFRFADQNRDLAHAYQRLVMEQNREIVGFAAWKQMAQNGRYRLTITVHPAHERLGMGTAVYNQIIETIKQQQPAPIVLEAGTYAHKPQGVRFLEQRGFEIVMRWIISTLDVQAFDETQFGPLLQKIAAQGIDLVPLPQLKQRDPNWQRAIYELDWELSQDEPLPSPPTKPPFELYQKYEFENPKQIEEAWFMAVENGRYLGMTQLFRTDDPALVKTGFTGTVRSQRRRGLATALKARAISHAKRLGVQTIRTGNEANNPMYALNQQLGFQDLTANLAFEKQLMR